MRIGSQRYDINWPRSRHGHKYTKYKMFLEAFEAQFIWSNTEAELKKSVYLKYERGMSD